jgi:hypothetical protein
MSRTIGKNTYWLYDNSKKEYVCISNIIYLNKNDGDVENVKIIPIFITCLSFTLKIHMVQLTNNFLMNLSPCVSETEQYIGTEMRQMS